MPQVGGRLGGWAQCRWPRPCLPSSRLHLLAAAARALPCCSTKAVQALQPTRSLMSQPHRCPHHRAALPPPRGPLLTFPLLACRHLCRRIIDVLEGEHGVEVRQLWGMTELSPCGTLGAIKASDAGQLTRCDVRR